MPILWYFLIFIEKQCETYGTLQEILHVNNTDGPNQRTKQNIWVVTLFALVIGIGIDLLNTSWIDILSHVWNTYVWISNVPINPYSQHK